MSTLGAGVAAAGDLIVAGPSSLPDGHDTNPGDGVCADSLGFCPVRAAIEEAAARPVAVIVAVTSGDYVLTLGPLEIPQGDVTISGPLGTPAVLRQTTADSVLRITGSATRAGIARVVFTGGNAVRGGGLHIDGALVLSARVLLEQSGVSELGGGVYVTNGGSFACADCDCRQNNAGAGGCFAVSGAGSRVTFAASRIDENTAFEGGGGYGETGATVGMTDTRCQSNDGGFSGGCLSTYDTTVRLFRVVMRYGVALSGAAGISSSGGDVTIVASTIADGLGSSMLLDSSEARIAYVTMYNGSMEFEPTVTLIGPFGGGGPPITFDHTVIADTTCSPAAPFCTTPSDFASFGANVVSAGHNFIETDPSGDFPATATDQVGTGATVLDAQLGPVADNGGFLPTAKPEPTSPLVDGGALGAPTDPDEAKDARGVPRPIDGNNDGTAQRDIGAHELTQCENGLDDDGDGGIDFATGTGDQQCGSLHDPYEIPECRDGFDNDGDDNIDYPSDRQCSGPDDDMEYGSCGLGVELALLLPLLGALRRRGLG